MTGIERRKRRARTRLRPGKVLSAEARFLMDCAIIDRSEQGARLRFFAVPDLQPEFLLFDESDNTLQAARLIWSAGMEAGVGFSEAALAVDFRDKERIAGRFYAIG